MDTAQLNELPDHQAANALGACCGATRWIEAMLGRRPFPDRDALRRAAEDIWWSLQPEDWIEAFSLHPRIGDLSNDRAQPGLGGAWSRGEQSRAARAGPSLQEELAQVNREYETRFGYIYVVCATGRSAEALLDLARARLRHDPRTELRVAAGEQLRITLLRLDKLLAGES